MSEISRADTSIIYSCTTFIFLANLFITVHEKKLQSNIDPRSKSHSHEKITPNRQKDEDLQVKTGGMISPTVSMSRK